MSDTLTIRLNLDSGTPAYRQIIDALRILLVSKKLSPGTVLPSVRRLALDLGVHFNTVAEAYRTLADEGWLDLRHGRSATVLERNLPSPAKPDLLQDFRYRLRVLVAEMRAQGAPAAKLCAELRMLAGEMEP